MKIDFEGWLKDTFVIRSEVEKIEKGTTFEKWLDKFLIDDWVEYANTYAKQCHREGRSEILNLE